MSGLSGLSADSLRRLKRDFKILTLDPKRRKRIVHNAMREVVKNARANLRAQKNADGTPFAPRKASSSFDPFVAKVRTKRHGVIEVKLKDPEKIKARRKALRERSKNDDYKQARKAARAPMLRRILRHSRVISTPESAEFKYRRIIAGRIAAEHNEGLKPYRKKEAAAFTLPRRNFFDTDRARNAERMKAAILAEIQP